MRAKSSVRGGDRARPICVGRSSQRLLTRRTHARKFKMMQSWAEEETDKDMYRHDGAVNEEGFCRGRLDCLLLMSKFAAEVLLWTPRKWAMWALLREAR